MGVYTQVATINAGESLSNAINCSQQAPVRVRMPASWTGGNQGAITFQISTDNISFMDYFSSDGKEVSAIVTPNTTTRVDHTIGGKGTTWIKIRTGTREAPVIQNSKIDFTVVLET